MRAPFRSIALFLVMLAPGPAALGQQQPAMVPTELAQVLLEGNPMLSGAGTPRFVVGRAPNGLPTSLTSGQGAVILGGVEYPQMSILVLAFASPPYEALKAFDVKLEAGGWKPPPPSPMQGSGFVGDNSSSYSGTIYCSDTGTVQLLATPGRNGGSYLRVENNRNMAMSFCRRPDPYAYNIPFKFPPLRPPRGMAQQVGGGGSGGDNIETSARLLGLLTPPEIVAHYIKQLDSAGWKMGATVVGGPVAVVPAEATDSLGGRWVGALTAWRVNPNEVEVNIKMARPIPR